MIEYFEAGFWAVVLFCFAVLLVLYIRAARNAEAYKRMYKNVYTQANKDFQYIEALKKAVDIALRKFNALEEQRRNGDLPDRFNVLFEMASITSLLKPFLHEIEKVKPNANRKSSSGLPSSQHRSVDDRAGTKTPSRGAGVSVAERG